MKDTNTVTTITSAIRSTGWRPQHNKTKNSTKYIGPATVISIDSVSGAALYTPPNTVPAMEQPNKKNNIKHM
jgi:adenylate cyclase class IV